MEKLKKCKYCSEFFEPRRRNHLYCTSSCKTMASYKRNNYKYIAGHYQKAKHANQENLSAPLIQKGEKPNNIQEEQVEKKDGVNVSSVANAALGSLAANVAVNGVKRVFAPNSLPATKSDVAALKNEMNALKMMLRNYKSNKFPF